MSGTIAPIGLDYGTGGQVVTITLASLASAAARQSNDIANTGSPGFTDILVQLNVQPATTGVSATGTVNIYAVASTDGGTTYGESAGNSDAAITLTSPTNAKLVGSFNVVADTTVKKSNPYSVAAAFGGTLPEYVVIIVQNNTGAAFGATTADFLLQYQGVMFGQ